MREKKTKLKAAQNIAALMVIIGILLCVGAKTVVTMLIAAGLFIAGGISCIIIEDIMGMMEEEPEPEDVRKELEKQDKEECGKGAFSYIYRPEYTFVQYLEDNSCSLKELLEYMDNPDSGMLFEEVYQHYVADAAGDRVQSRESVQSIIWRERKRYETPTEKEMEE